METERRAWALTWMDDHCEGIILARICFSREEPDWLASVPYC